MVMIFSSSVVQGFAVQSRTAELWESFQLRVQSRASYFTGIQYTPSLVLEIIVHST